MITLGRGGPMNTMSSTPNGSTPRRRPFTRSRNQDGGLRFHDLRHSYATWLVDDGVPPNMVQRVMGHERVITTLQLYTRRTDNRERILRALNKPGDNEDDGGATDFLLTPSP
jgi:integrase